MLSTQLAARAQEDIQFKLLNIEQLQNQIVETDDQKSLYDEGIVKLELEVLNRIEVVNKSFNDVSEAYDAAIASDCKSDLFWRVIDFTSGESDEFTLECTRLSGGGYQNTASQIRGSSGIGSTVAYVGTTGIVTYYPVNETYGAGFPDDVDLVNDPYFGFDRRNRYGLKIYSEPFDKDIGDTLVGEFIGTCSIGSTVVTVMQEVGAGLTFGTGQILVSAGKTAIFPNNATIVGVGTTTQDIRSIPSTGIGSTGVVVNLLTVDVNCGAPASAPELDGSFVRFRVLDDPIAFQSGGRKRYDIPFDQDPFTPQTISIASTATLGTGVSVYLDNSGALNNPQSWDPNLKILSVEDGGAVEPEVGAGQVFYKIGFGHAPVLLGNARAVEGDTRVVSASSTALSTNLYTQLSSCSSAVEDEITNQLGISSTKETALIDQEGDNNLLIESVQALRDQRNQLQLGIHGIRKVLGTLNEEADKLESLQRLIGITTVSDIVK